MYFCYITITVLKRQHADDTAAWRWQCRLKAFCQWSHLPAWDYYVLADFVITWSGTTLTAGIESQQAYLWHRASWVTLYIYLFIMAWVQNTIFKINIKYLNMSCIKCLIVIIEKVKLCFHLIGLKNALDYACTTCKSAVHQTAGYCSTMQFGAHKCTSFAICILGAINNTIAPTCRSQGQCAYPTLCSGVNWTLIIS